MVVKGDALPNPEKDWIRIDNTDANIVWIGNWTNASPSLTLDQFYNSTAKFLVGAGNLGAKFSYSFLGEGIRLIGNAGNTTNNAELKITVDGVIETVILNGNGTTREIRGSLMYEKVNLSWGMHTIEVQLVKDGGWQTDIQIDAFDILINKNKKKATFKNPKTNQYYSLAEKTLITLPDTSSKNMTLYGLEAGEEIRLDEAFNQMNYVTEGSKLFIQKLETAPNALRIKEVD